MSGKRYTEEFKIEAVKQVTDRGYRVADVAARLGVSEYTLYQWRKRYGLSKTDQAQQRQEHPDPTAAKGAEARHGGARHSKKGRRVLCQGVRVKYAFIRDHRADFRVTAMCRVLKVQRSGFYAWLKTPLSERAKEDQRLLGLVKQSWLESGGIYGYRKVHDDLREWHETCGKHRVERLMRTEGLRSQTGYRKPRIKGGKSSVVADNHLQQQFDVAEPDWAWVTDITYIRTWEGWLYLAWCWTCFRGRSLVGPWARDCTPIWC